MPRRKVVDTDEEIRFQKAYNDRAHTKMNMTHVITRVEKLKGRRSR